MSSDECARLVNLIVSTWPTGAKGHVWTDTLGTLSYSPALRAYRRLREEDERPPAPARFLTTYRAVVAADAPPSPPRQMELIDPPLPADDPRAAAAFARGFARGQAELGAMRQHWSDPERRW